MIATKGKSPKRFPFTLAAKLESDALHTIENRYRGYKLATYYKLRQVFETWIYMENKGAGSFVLTKAPQRMPKNITGENPAIE